MPFLTPPSAEEVAEAARIIPYLNHADRTVFDTFSNVTKLDEATALKYLDRYG